jgi:transposase
LTQNSKKRYNYTMRFDFNQLILHLNLGIEISKDDSVTILNQICNKLDYSKLYDSYCRIWRKHDPVMSFKILVFGNMNDKYSCSDWENVCKRDIFVMWLLNRMRVPDSTTFAYIQNERLVEVIEDLFTNS